MRWIFGFVCVCALCAVPLVGCSETGGESGSGGTAGTGGAGGNSVACVDSVCPCTEAGIRAAIAQGGGPFTFDCADYVTVVTEAQIFIDNDVVLDGEGHLIVSGGLDHRVFSVAKGVTAQLDTISVTRGFASGNGGGILNSGTLALIDVDVTESFADSGRGGGINNDGTLTMSGGSVSDNNAVSDGGISNAGVLTMTDFCDVSRNESVHYFSDDMTNGGGLGNVGTLTMTNCTVSGNATEVNGGGGIDNRGTATITDSALSGNVTGFDCGGISNWGTLTIANSSLSRNSASGFRSNGAGICSTGPTTITNCTISENQGGVYLSGAGPHALISSTVSELYTAGNTTLANTLVVGACHGDGTLASDGYNIESPGNTCGFSQPTDQLNVSADDLNLGPLARDGTHALIPGSVAIDVIPEADCVDADGASLTTDQRGEPRPETGGTMCDVGAFEVQP